MLHYSGELLNSRWTLSFPWATYVPLYWIVLFWRFQVKKQPSDLPAKKCSPSRTAALAGLSPSLYDDVSQNSHLYPKIDNTQLPAKSIEISIQGAEDLTGTNPCVTGFEDDVDSSWSDASDPEPLQEQVTSGYSVFKVCFGIYPE